MEIANGVTRSGLSIRDWLTACARRVGHHSRHRREILDDEVRWVLTKAVADVDVDRGRQHRARGQDRPSRR